MAQDFLYSSAFIFLNEDSWFSDGYVDLKGMGWGHGVGLCQMGALGMALAGKNHEEILLHYYPGSSLPRMGRRRE